MGVSVDVQTKVFEILSADPLLLLYTGSESRVYDVVPDDKKYPFIQIGEDDIDDFGAHDVDGFEVNIRIHTWSQQQSTKECKLIQDRIRALLHNVDLALTGQNTVSLRVGMATVMLDPEDGRTHHGVINFKLLLGG